MTRPDDDKDENRLEPDEPAPETKASAYPDSALLQAAYDAIDEAIVITGANLDPPGPRIEYVNPGFVRLTGYSAEEVVGHSPRMLQGPRTDRRVLDRLRAALEAGKPSRGSVVNYRKDGIEYEVEWLITPVRDASDRVVRWVAAQRDVTGRKRADAHLRRLLDELNHRVNNTLAAVQSLAIQTLQNASCSDARRACFLARLLALSRVHRILVQGFWSGAPLRALAEAQLGHHVGGDLGRFDVQGPDVWLRPGAAVTVGLALHELAANAAVHGALSVPVGRVSLGWFIDAASGDGHLLVHWAERGGPPVQALPRHRGFGSRLLERGLARELQAATDLRFEPAGVRCDIDMPLKAVTGRAH